MKPVLATVTSLALLTAASFPASAQSRDSKPYWDLPSYVLLKRIKQKYPGQIEEWNRSCTHDLRLSSFHHNGSQRVGFICWNPPAPNGERSGAYLGVLPYPGQEAAFPVAIASDDFKIQAVLDRKPRTVQKMGFDCAVQGGSINILVDETAVTLQCFFQAGVQLLDSDGDGVSEGELSMGASVDFTRTIPRNSPQS